MFTENHKIVQDYVTLINAGEKAIDDVPDFQNLREVVAHVLAN